MNNELTKKQKEVFEQICKYIDENGYSPTVRELCNLCGLSSSATMWVHLQKLKNKGFIYYDDKKFRTIRTNLHDDLEQKYNDLQEKIDKAHIHFENRIKWWLERDYNKVGVHNIINLLGEIEEIIYGENYQKIGEKENE